MTSPSDLKDILQLLKDFDVQQVKLTMGEISLECSFSRPSNNQPTIKKPFTNFPDAKYNAAISSDITKDELAELGFVGVAPTATNIESVTRRSKKSS